MRRYYSRRPPLRLTRRQRWQLLCLLAAALLTVLGIVTTFHLKNVLTSLATTRVSNTVNRVVTAAVNDTVSSGEIRYDQLIFFEKDNEGKITALQTNMAEFNRLQSEIVSDILERLSEVSTSELSIPLGTLTGTALLAGRGPSVSVRMQFVGSSSARFENEFTEAGINQTKHRIILYVDVSVSILLPGFSAYTKVSNAFAVAETVIVGSVPDTYTYFSSGDPVEDKAHEYIMTKG